jgi:hypothetical protein
VATLNADRSEELFTAYITALNSADAPAVDADDWTELQWSRGWEHSQLLHGADLGTLLGGSLDTRAVLRSRSRSHQLADALAIEAQYVAVVDNDHRFVSLIDRQALLEELATQHEGSSRMD